MPFLMELGKSSVKLEIDVKKKYNKLSKKSYVLVK